VGLSDILKLDVSLQFSLREWNGPAELLSRQQAILARAAKDMEYAMSHKIATSTSGLNEPFAMRQLKPADVRVGSKAAARFDKRRGSYSPINGHDGRRLPRQLRARSRRAEH
jgi:hypothetical protein